MIYETYQLYADLTDPLRWFAHSALAILGPHVDRRQSSPLLNMSAAYELVALTGLSHTRPPFCIDSVIDNGREVRVTEEVVHRTPFGDLLRFKKNIRSSQPRVLLVAPLSGHFATLLRGTVLTLLQDHDVYITDWCNPRETPVSDGRFGLDDYVLHLIHFLEVLGPGAHMVAVCQPTVAALAAVALMAQDNHPAQPSSLTLMAGPVDCRINPTKVNQLATSKPIEWFERTLIGTVPQRYAGAGRKVYPGFLQLLAFMNMNPDRHLHSFVNLFDHRIKGDFEKADAIKVFYEEYFATMDLPAEFYIETIRSIFQDYDLPLGRLMVGGRLVEPSAIHRTALLTIEGEKDDICAVGQTLAAQDLCSRLRPYLKTHHVQTGVGHYGVFNGRRWESQVYPLLREVIHTSD